MDDKTDKEKLHIELFATNAYSNKIYAKWRNLCQNYNPTKKKKKKLFKSASKRRKRHWDSQNRLSFA